MAIWFFLSLIRSFVSGQLSVADGWNDEREADLVQKMRQGRRSQQVLAVSLHTALRESGAHDGEAQRVALLDVHKALLSRLPALLRGHSPQSLGGRTGRYA